MEVKDIIALAICAIIAIIIIVYLIINERDKINEWLKIAVTEAEKIYGGGTGQLKLRKVYDWFIKKFPIVASVMSFKTFSLLVDYALGEMRYWIAQNSDIKKYVEAGINENQSN